MPQQVWIGLAEVVRQPGADALLDRNSAFVNVLALAADLAEFERAARDGLAAEGFRLVELEDAEPMAKRTSEVEVDPVLVELAAEVVACESARFGTFHTWRMKDGD